MKNNTQGELTPETREAISRLRIAILAEDEGVLARLDDLVAALSGPPSGQESRAGGAAPQEPDFANIAASNGARLFEALEEVARLRATLDQAEQALRRLREERLMLAKLACPEAQFFNPIEAAAAESLRDRLLDKISW